MIEDSTHLQQVKEIYKEEVKQEDEEVFYEWNPGTTSGEQQEE